MKGVALGEWPQNEKALEIKGVALGEWPQNEKAVEIKGVAYFQHIPPN
jgi:hypothetical protein